MKKKNWKLWLEIIAIGCIAAFVAANAIISTGKKMKLNKNSPNDLKVLISNLSKEKSTAESVTKLVNATNNLTYKLSLSDLLSDNLTVSPEEECDYGEFTERLNLIVKQYNQSIHDDSNKNNFKLIRIKVEKACKQVNNKDIAKAISELDNASDSAEKQFTDSKIKVNGLYNKLPDNLSRGQKKVKEVIEADINIHEYGKAYMLLSAFDEIKD